MRQVWRDDDSAIYEYFGGYEVIAIKKAPAQTIMGRSYPSREVYPSDGEWGTLAITRPSTDSMAYLKRRAAELARSRPTEQEASGKGSREKGSQL
jgi:hypothetical protein